MTEEIQVRKQIEVPRISIDGFDLTAAFVTSVQTTDTPMDDRQVGKRLGKMHTLIRALFRRMDAMGGDRPPMIAEAGVWRGLSARVMAMAVTHRMPHWTGETMHVLDGFTGLGKPAAEDVVELADGTRSAFSHSTNFESSPEIVKASLSQYPAAHIHKGLIPAVLMQLPDAQWDFIHLDTDHFEPTRDSLAYFVPRMRTGGMLVDDDYGSQIFPGPRRAWDAAARENGLRFEVAAETGQSIATVD